ncbi:MAG: S8 family serine peptidase [Bacteroidales bacterium]|nr:S8 family serine peptidase [Bacteroidales bacterium]
MKISQFMLAALALVGIACTKEFPEGALGLQESTELGAKLVGGTDGEIAPGTLLVRLDAQSVKAIEEGRLAEVSQDLLDGIEGATLTSALPVQPKNMEVARKYGLDQWFMVSFGSQTSAEEVAKEMAASRRVRSIQYNRLVQPVWEGQVHPFEAMPMTKAQDPEQSGMFNDEYASYQWNLYNDGSIDENAVPGADVGVKDAWRLTGGDPSVVVAIFDCAVANRHEDLQDALWQNEAEVNGQADVDDDGNGFIDDKYGFNFVNCYSIDAEYVEGALKGQKQTALKGNPLNSTAGSGHGTHVAGIIGATNNNGKGVSSIAGGTGNGDGVRLMTCQIFQGSSYCADAQNAAAFIYAADNGACIAQCSYGNANIITSDDIYINGGEIEQDGQTIKVNSSTLENAALKYFLDPANSNHESLEGNMAIFAAGNHKNPYSIYPGALPYVISVTAFGCDFQPGTYTNYGPGCKISAPGGEYKGVQGEYGTMILSTGVSGAATQSPGVETGKGQSKSYVYMQGTSMACPHVSGVVALGLSYAKKIGKKFTREELTSLLLTSVNDIDRYMASGSQYHNRMGTGAVDAWKFLMAIEGTPWVMAEVGQKVKIDLSKYCNPWDTYTITIDEASRKSLGLTSDPVKREGFLEIECTKVGAGKITLSAAVGKDPDKTDGIGEMSYSREISIVSRAFATNNGGWL